MPNDPEFAAKMTNIQFCAMAQHLNEAAIVSMTAPLACAKSQICDLATVTRWVRNAWNTERVLRLNLDNFAPSDLNACVHWALPQAYYSVFSTTLALFNVIGRNETSHSAVIKQFGLSVVAANRYPQKLNFYATGTIQNEILSGVRRVVGGQTINYDKADASSVENQIAQFLSATRKERLRYVKDRNFCNTFKNKRGKKLKNFKEPQWEKVAESAGPTSLLSLLYRKRITANYDDIGTITSELLDGKKLISDLLTVVRSCNLVHEHLIYCALGKTDFETLHDNKQKFEFVLDSRQKLDAG